MNISNVSLQDTQLIKTKSEKMNENASNAIRIEENGNEKLALALSALSAVSIAALAIIKGKGKGASKIIKNSADDIAKQAVETVKNGANYGQVKKTATKNLDKTGKKIVKEAMSDALSDKRTTESIVKQNVLNNTATVRNAEKTAAAVNQGIKSATEEVVQSKMDAASKAVEVAAKTLGKQKELVSQNPTHKKQKLVRYLENQSEKTKINSLKVQENGKKRIAEIKETAAKKAENIAKQKSSQNYQLGVEKMAENAKKTTQNSFKKEIKQIRNTGAYKNAIQKFNHKSPEQLRKMLDQDVLNKHQRQAILDILENIEKTVI